MADQNTGQEKPTPTPGENQPTDGQDVNNLGEPSTQEPSAEQAEWDNLSGKAQQRFSNLLRRAKSAEQDLEEFRQKDLQAQNDLNRVSQPPTNYQGYQTKDPREEEVERAIETLKNRGFRTFDEVKELVRQEVSQATRSLSLQREHDRLKETYERLRQKDPRVPAYDPEEVEDYGRQHNIFNPEAAYKDMYWDEWMDIGSPSRSSKKIAAKPGSGNASVREEPMSLDKLREKLSGPEGKEYYREQMEKNPEKFQQLISKLTTG